MNAAPRSCRSTLICWSLCNVSKPTPHSEPYVLISAKGRTACKHHRHPDSKGNMKRAADLASISCSRAATSSTESPPAAIEPYQSSISSSHGGTACRPKGKGHAIGAARHIDHAALFAATVGSGASHQSTLNEMWKHAPQHRRVSACCWWTPGPPPTQVHSGCRLRTPGHQSRVPAAQLPDAADIENEDIDNNHET